MLKSRETTGVNKTIITYLDFRKAMSYSFDRTTMSRAARPAPSPRMVC